ncbi:hypothetical protein BYT27DRAFT_7190888 [Phlegmacium glaucopus]|nr:hypothetical protein BYT27DRAFT_7190888 [Phlegmacium glaucopus]
MTCDFGFAMQEILVKAFIKNKFRGSKTGSPANSHRIAMFKPKIEDNGPRAKS